MSRYSAKYVGAESAPEGWTKVGSVAIDTAGIAGPSNVPFVPGVDDSYGKGYIVISDTTRTGLVGRTTGTGTSGSGGGGTTASANTPTYWASPNKYDYSFIDFVKKLPNISGRGYTISTINDAITALSTELYWCSYDESLRLLLNTNDSVSLDGKSPNAWNDLSGNKKSYVINNCVIGTLGGLTVLGFRGTASSDYVNIGRPIAIGPPGITVFAWVYNQNNTGFRDIVSSDDTIEGTGLYLGTRDGDLRAGIAGVRDIVIFGGDYSLPLNVWKFVAFTFDDNKNAMVLYIDGSRVDTNLGVTQSYVMSETYIGSGYSGGTNSFFWEGYISEVRMYSRALSESEISDEFNWSRTLYGL